MKKIIEKIKKSIAIFASITLLIYSVPAYSHSSRYIIEIPEETLQNISKASSVISTSFQTMYVLNNLTTLGVAGVFQLVGLAGDLDGTLDGALSDMLAESGISEMFSDISDGLFEGAESGLEDVFGDLDFSDFDFIDFEDLAMDLFEGDYYGATTGVFGDDLGFGDAVDLGMLEDYAGPVFENLVEAAFNGGDMSAILEEGMMNVAYDAMDYAIEQGTLAYNDTSSAIYEELDVNGLSGSLNETIVEMGGTPLDIDSMMPSSENMLKAAMNGGDFSGIMNDMQSKALSQLQDSGMAMGEQFLEDFSAEFEESFNAHFDTAMGESSLMGDLKALYAEGSEYADDLKYAFGEVNAFVAESAGLYNDIAGELNDVTGDLNSITGDIGSISGDLGLNGLAIGSIPGVSTSISGLLESELDFPTNTGSLNIIDGYVDKAYSSAVYDLTSGKVDSNFSDLGLELDMSYGLDDLISKPSLSSTPLVPASIAPAIASGNFEKINTARYDDVMMVSQEDPITSVQLTTKTYQTMIGDVYGATETMMAALMSRDYYLDENGNSMSDIKNLAVKDAVTVSATEATSISTQDTGAMELDSMGALIATYEATTDYIINQKDIINSLQKAPDNRI